MSCIHLFANVREISVSDTAIATPELFVSIFTCNPMKKLNTLRRSRSYDIPVEIEVTSDEIDLQGSNCTFKLFNKETGTAVALTTQPTTTILVEESNRLKFQSLIDGSVHLADFLVGDKAKKTIEIEYLVYITTPTGEIVPGAEGKIYSLPVDSRV